ncbi:ubiquitin-like protein Pup [Kineococcus sp. T13]|uniref:ubiquitin-like protein Pup n=1 Tax=Kineococcus vitellinus TaxID=2696565 RepID=UPI001411BECD|nr:ubiquitin-like protein Pup [Kineococcus vitellinus]NAZ75343.1 ubiquitin-like protein Pup [Kineococcus vitellinus]
MPGQEQQRPSRREEEVEETPVVPAQASAETTETDADVDALLDEIDEVLESNSEEFVRGFVQKGGQ